MYCFQEKPCKCGNHYIINKTYWLCNDCNYIRLYNKTKFEVSIERQKQKQKKIPLSTHRKSKKPLKSSKNYLKQERLEKRRKVLKKDRELYFYWFSTKPCECEECGAGLPDIFENDDGSIVYIAQYSHILSKGAFPEFRHHKLNGNRLCLFHHNQWEFGDRESMKIFKSNQKIIQEIKQNPLNLI
jgi:hypothetical protein